MAFSTACSPSTTLTEAWLNESYDGAPFQKIIVLAPTTEGAMRRDFEDRFTAALTASGVQAVQGYSVLPDNLDMSPDDLRQAVQRVGADGVLVTRLVSVEQVTRTSPGHVRSFPHWGFGGNFYRNSHTVLLRDPPRTTTSNVAELQTDLWSLRGEGTLVWSGMSRAFSPRDAGQVGGELANAVVEDLRSGGVLAPAQAR